MNELREEINDARDVVVNEFFSLIEILTRLERHDEAFDKEKEIEKLDKRVEQVCDDIHDYMKQSKDLKPNFGSDVSCRIEHMALPRFSGKDYFKWRALFDVIIDGQPMTKQIKILRLLSCLDGEAKELVKNYPPIPESYDAALKRLEMNYGGTKRMMSEAIRKVKKRKNN